MTWNVRAFGARGDGLADDTAPINTAIAAAAEAGGGTVEFPAGTYRCQGVAGRHRVSLRGSGATLLKHGGGRSTHILDLIGGLSAIRTALLSRAAEGSDLLVLDRTDGFSAGDRVLLRDGRFAARNRGRNQELNRIVEVATSWVRLATPTIGSYLELAGGAELVRLEPMGDFTIEGLSFIVPELGTGFAGGAVYGRLGDHITLRECTAVGPDDDAGFQFEQCAWITIDGCSVRDGQHGGALGRGNGIVIGESSHHCLVTRCRTENVSENAFESNVRCSSFLSNIDVGSYDDSFNTHGSACRDIQIRGNLCLNGRAAGITVGFEGHRAGDMNVTVADNMILDPGTHGISVAAPDGRPNANITLRGNSIIRPSRARAGCDGICVVGSRHVAVIDNQILGGGAKPAHGILAADSYGVTIQGNSIRDLTDGYGVAYTGCSELTITENRIAEVSSFNVYASPPRPSSRVLIRANQADDGLLSVQSEDVVQDGLITRRGRHPHH